MSKQARIVAGLAFGVLLLAAPVAGALSWGVDASGVGDLRASGGSPQLGQTWVGAWMKTYGWSGYENDLRTMSAAGVTPVVLWYYWGDAISVNCVQYGCNGLSKSEWDSMAQQLASRANSVIPGKTFDVVLEPEFNKNGIESWETFDGYLANQASIIRAAAPNARIVVGFGNWGGWDIFDRAAGASDMVGFQLLYGSTRTAQSTALASADTMLSIATTLHGKFGKPLLVFDFDIATYGGWEWVQQQAIQSVTAKASQLQAAGIQSIVWRYVKDNSLSSGYFGAAESTWGVEYSNGVHKSGYAALVAATTSGGLVSATTTTTTQGTMTTATTTTNPFSNVKGNAWWIEATVAGSPLGVTAVLSPGGAYHLAKTSWGSWAISAYAPSGTLVTLSATYGDGSTRTATYQWTAATLVTTTSTTTTSTTSSGGATFSGVTGNSWWVQVSVGGPQAIAAVSARVNGGSWISLSKQSWGGFAKSFYVAPGSSVQFQATNTAGGVTTSGNYPW